MKHFWKEASSIILTALKKSPANSDWNYELLTLQRSTKSSFMPKGWVFPGGAVEPSDSDKKWVELFSNFNLNIKELCKLNGGIPPILENASGDLPKLLSLKITAVRETFEETGILLCFGKNETSTHLHRWVSHSLNDLDSWRGKVQKDPNEFLNLCYAFSCCPDVGNLHLWSNWLTPTSMGKKRFDTVFFVGCLNQKPGAVADKTEIDKLSWNAPEDLMKLCTTKDIWLPPPQVYETARFLQFKDIKKLNNFASDRSLQGCERWMPIRIKTSDGSVSLLPGDDAYNLVDYYNPIEPNKIKMSNKEFRKESKVLHRMEFLDETVTKIIIKDYSPTNGHVLPVCE